MIRAYTGILGQGKTIAMVDDALDYLAKGMPVITNTPIILRDHPIPLKFWDKLRGKKQRKRTVVAYYAPTETLLHLFKTTSNALFLIDESSVVFSNYSKNLLSGDYLARLAQSRKFGLDIFYTTQLYEHTHRRFRDLTNEVEVCQFFKKLNTFTNIVYDAQAFNNKVNPAFLGKYKLRVHQIPPWRANYLYKCYDTRFTVQHSATLSISQSTQLYIESPLLAEIEEMRKRYAPPRRIQL